MTCLVSRFVSQIRFYLKDAKHYICMLNSCSERLLVDFVVETGYPLDKLEGMWITITLLMY